MFDRRRRGRRATDRDHRSGPDIFVALNWLVASFSAFLVAWFGGPMILAFAVTAAIIWLY